jgi:hypothetical protein
MFNDLGITQSKGWIFITRPHQEKIGELTDPSSGLTFLLALFLLCGASVGNWFGRIHCCIYALAAEDACSGSMMEVDLTLSIKDGSYFL